MKKLMAILVALSVALSGSYTVLASAPENVTTVNGREVIPVYGYVGSDKHVIPPDVDVPEIPSDVEIYVEIPVQIMFAAIESAGGVVVSPVFTIRNLSEKNDVKVEIENFEQNANSAVDVDGKLTLMLTNPAYESVVSELFPGEYQTKKLLVENLPRYTEESNAHELEFRIGGHWSGSFAEELQPVFDMTLMFSAIAD